jgi:hypothetical protein
LATSLLRFQNLKYLSIRSLEQNQNDAYQILMTSLYRSLPPNIEELYLNYHIENVYNFFKENRLSRLKKLSMYESIIESELSLDIFEGLRSLESLILINNRIKKIKKMNNTPTH